MRSSRFLTAAVAAGLIFTAPSTASAAWHATAVDASHDGHVDRVAMTDVPGALRHCATWRVAGQKASRVARHGASVTPSLRDGRISAPKRPVVTCTTRHRSIRATLRAVVAKARKTTTTTTTPTSVTTPTSSPTTTTTTTTTTSTTTTAPATTTTTAAPTYPVLPAVT